MTLFLTPFLRLISFATPWVASGDVAHRLMERAEVRAGHSPREAQQLRDAAFAYLSVVR